MARPLVAEDGIAIAELIFFLLALIAAILLCLRHGFTKDLAWRAILVLSLVRVIGSSLRLATIPDPLNTNLYIGWQVLNGIGLAPLLLLLTGLLGRVFIHIPVPGAAFSSSSSSSSSSSISIRSLHRRAVLIVVLVAIVLFSVGGSRSTFVIVDGQPKTDYSPISKVAVALQIIVLVVTAAGSVFASLRIAYVPPTEQKIAHVVALCVPLVSLRLAYTSLLVFGGRRASPWLYLGMSLLPEVLVTLVSIILGFSLRVLPKNAEPLPQSEC